MAEERSLALRPTGALAFPGHTPVHERKAPVWTDAPLTREECLQLLPSKVRETAFERIGASIEWWATDLSNHEGIMLVAFGSKALVVVTPAAGREGKPAFKLETIQLEEKSRRKAHLKEVASQAPPAGAKPPQGVGQADLARRMTSMHRFLGLLPSRAQQLMQEPFAGGTDELDTDYLIFRYGASETSSGAQVHLWGYITDRRVLTVCSGVGYGYRDGTGASSWDLNCWRVETAGRKAVTA